ncbi:MAG: LPS export ABC transporter permease LptF [Candidatus Competibacterales bacterium]
MFRSLDRYLIREVTLTLGAVLAVILVLVLTHRLGVYLHQAAGGLLAKGAIAQLLGLQAIRYGVILLPLATLLAVMLAFGRLYRDSELIAIGACGYGPGNLYRALALLGLPLALLLTWLTLDVAPRAMRLNAALTHQARQDAELSAFTPGTFRQVSRGEYVIYIAGVDREARELRGIFVQSNTPSRVEIITASRGYQQLDPATGARYIVLQQGRRYEGLPGRGSYRTTDYQTQSGRLDTPPQQRLEAQRETLSVPDLLAWDSPAATAEFHRRLGVPLSLLVTLFLAPLIARAKPQEGRYSRVFAAILLYIIYQNALHVGTIALEREWVAPHLGLWWVHGALVATGIGLFWHHYGLPRPMAPKPPSPSVLKP